MHSTPRPSLHQQKPLEQITTKQKNEDKREKTRGLINEGKTGGVEHEKKKKNFKKKG